MQTGRAPCGLAVRAGSVWVGVYETGEVLGVDADSGRIHVRVEVGRWACRVAVGPAAIWVTRDQARELVRISRGTGRIRRTSVPGQPFDVLLARGSLWTTGYDTGTISRLYPVVRPNPARYRDGPSPAGLAWCGGRIWVGHGGRATWLTSIDPTTNRLRRVDVGTVAPGWPSCIRGALWVTTPDSFLRLDPRTGNLLSQQKLGETLAHAALGPDGLVWMTDKQNSVVHRLTSDGRVLLDRFPAGPGAFALARVGGSMWISSFAGSDVRRYEPYGWGQASA